MKEREIEIDVLKAVGIILMIMGHQYYGEHFDKWIHAFHMPMFFVISGYLYKRPNSIKASILNKVRTLLVPYIFFALIHFGVMCFKDVLTGVGFSNVSNYLYHICLINTEGMPICGAIWFLTASFFTYSIYMVLDKKILTEKIKIGYICIITVIGMVFPLWGYRMPLALDVAMASVGLFCIGICLRKLYERVNCEGKFRYGLLGMIVCYVTIMCNKDVNLRLANYGNFFLFFFNATIMIIALYIIVKQVIKKKNFIIEEFVYIGQNSIVYLGFNQLILIFLKKISFENEIINTIYKFIALLLCLGVLHFISFVLNKRIFKPLIGKKKLVQ